MSNSGMETGAKVVHAVVVTLWDGCGGDVYGGLGGGTDRWGGGGGQGGNCGMIT